MSPKKKGVFYPKRVTSAVSEEVWAKLQAMDKYPSEFIREAINEKLEREEA